MRYSYHWLKELSGTKKSAEQLAKLLMTHAFEVEGIEKCSLVSEQITVGKVVELKQHPNADKLRVAQIELGKRDIRTIVCGAPNIALGQKVAVALPGTVLPGNIEIRETVIRDVASQGMVCSAKELGLGDDHNGILVLPEDTPVGAPFGRYFGFDDSIIEVKILPDRGSDALAYQGLAREIAALDGHAPRFVETSAKPIKIPAYNRTPKITIADKIGCHRYIGIVFRDIAVGESPLWLKAKLLLSGLRPVSNIVDITNYLMLLTGQPMHAFDMDKTVGAITIRRAKKNEKIQLLNGETKTLSLEDLVIADTERALALAGVMGGDFSAVTGTTKTIFLEIANFDASTIRRTKTRHNLPTDASYRFERALDPNLAGESAREAVSLMTTITSGKIVGMRDVYPKPVKSRRIALSLSRVEDVLGTKVPLFEAVQYLALLGLGVKKISGKNALDVNIPSRRPDLHDEWDLIEEIGRMRGYEKIAARAPTLPLIPSAKDPAKRFEREAKEYLAHAGLDEILTYSFYGEKECLSARLPIEKHLELENPMNPDQRLLRLTLLPGLLRKIRDNIRHFEVFNCFEYGSVFAGGDKKRPITEKKMIALATVSGHKSGTGESFFALKGKVTAFLAAMHIKDISFEPFMEKETGPENGTMFHPTRSALVTVGGRTVGSIGELHPTVAKDFSLDSRVAVAEFDAALLVSVRNEELLYAPLQKFPYARRDLSLTFPSASRSSATVAATEKLFFEAGAPLLRYAELFDVYEQDGEKSMAFHLSFGADDRTITSEEMDRSFDAIVTAAKERFEARLRV